MHRQGEFGTKYTWGTLSKARNGDNHAEHDRPRSLFKRREDRRMEKWKTRRKAER
jgi:hypothetical protein